MEKNPIIAVRNMIARYDERVILSDINLDIYAGEISVIIGGSGCGKTTLLKNILRLHDPESGSVKILGQETIGMDENAFEAILIHIGMLFQNGALINSISVADNVAMPLEQHTRLSRDLIEKIVEVKLGLVNLGHALQLLPSELSGGMKKRAALARAIALDPKILFCDEPSAGLDPLTSASLDELILKLRDQLNMTIVIVTHELASIHRVADRVIFLEDGKILFSGSVEQAKISGISAVKQFFTVGQF